MQFPVSSYNVVSATDGDMSRIMIKPAFAYAKPEDQWSCKWRSLKIMAIYMYLAPGQGQTTHWGIFFHKYNQSVNLVLCCKFSQLKNFVTVFPIQTYYI